MRSGLTASQIAFGAFLACAGYPKCKTGRKIVMSKEGKAEAKAEVPLDEPCPKCASKLAAKQGRFGEFTARSNYPTCKYIKMKETGVPDSQATLAADECEVAAEFQQECLEMAHLRLLEIGLGALVFPAKNL